MSDVSRKTHWESVYTTKGEREVSWFQENPAPSLELIALAGLFCRCGDHRYWRRRITTR
jgi:hypothetical protein